MIIVGCAAVSISRLDAAYGEASPRELTGAGADPDHYEQQVRPIIETRCAVCHGCYDAPCQLKLEAYSGLLRGANKTKVYDGTRLLGGTLTRLFEDADTTAGWRDKDFYPVLNERENTPEANLNASVMARLLTLKQAHPQPMSPVLPDSFDFSNDRAEQCPKIEEFDSFAKDYPLWGMPYGLPGLPEAEQQTLLSWLRHGAQSGPIPALDAALLPELDTWEKFFNGSDLKQRLVSRYLFEHLFLATLTFDQAPDVTFRLVRSRTAPGEPIERISTRRPFDDPGVERVYYRLWQDPSTRLAKTFLPYRLNAARMERWQQWFMQDDYSITQLPGYDPEIAANPFAAFAELPAVARYRFLLDEAQLTIMNFIKGPVCRGQIALNVIQDHFWVFFVNPDALALTQETEFLAANSEHLRLPAEAGSSTLRPITRWRTYAKLQENYLEAKAAHVSQTAETTGPVTLNNIWDGGGHNPNAALTIFRHKNSASVVKGLVGQDPKTAWIISYPLLERIHYLLVAGFDVYGNVSHQLLSRLYMDFLRMEGEMGFVALLPQDTQTQEINYWYRGAEDSLDAYLDSYLRRLNLSLDIRYRTDHPKQELYGKLKKYLAPALNSGDEFAAYQWPQALEKELEKIAAVKGIAASLLPEITFIHVRDQGNFSLLRTSAYSNLSSLFEEQERRRPEEDSLTLVRGLIGAYPNSFLLIDEKQLPDLAENLAALETEEDYRAFKRRFGVSRSDPNFWAISDKIHASYQEQQPWDANLLDYNRLENR